MEGYQRKYLRGLAHEFKPIVQVGHSGVTAAVARAVDVALTDHELIKVRMHEPEDKRALAAELAARTASEVCGLVGHTVILYRRHPKEPTIVLPVRPGDDHEGGDAPAGRGASS